jgi:hypothetical protein
MCTWPISEVSTMNTRLALCALALVLAAASGCTRGPYVPLQPTPEAFARERPNEVLVTRNDSSTVTLYRPEVVGDTLRGFDRSPDTNGPVSLVLIALRDIRSAETPAQIPLRIRNIGSLGNPVFVIAVIGGVAVVWVGVCLASKEWCALGIH